MDKNATKLPENQQNRAQNFLKSGNFLKILMPADSIIIYNSINYDYEYSNVHYIKHYYQHVMTITVHHY